MLNKINSLKQELRKYNCLNVKDYDKHYTEQEQKLIDILKKIYTQKYDIICSDSSDGYNVHIYKYNNNYIKIDTFEGYKRLRIRVLNEREYKKYMGPNKDSYNEDRLLVTDQFTFQTRDGFECEYF